MVDATLDKGGPVEVTKISVNPTLRQLRSSFAQLFSDFAREKGLGTAISQRYGDTKPPSRKAGRGKTNRVREGTAPQPDIQWMDRGRVVWKFHIFPSQRVLRRLCPSLKASDRSIVCFNSSGNPGVIAPAALLKFFGENGETLDNEVIESLARFLPPAQTPKSGYHFKGTVTKNRQFLKDHFSLRIKAPLAPKPVPGQFLQLLCDPGPHGEKQRYRRHAYSGGRLPKLLGAELLSKRPFLRRPFSLASYGPPTPQSALKESRRLGAEWLDLIDWAASEFEVIYRRVPDGPGTGALAAYEIGDEIDVVGPLGRGFNLEPLPKVALLVGGGIGSTPLIYLAEKLVMNGVDVRFFAGALTKVMIPFRLRGAPDHRIPALEKLGVSTTICTDDGSAGRRGLVTDPLEEYLENENGPGTKIYACGPRPMLAALEGIAIHHDVSCEALLEEMMACGFGACISCVCGVKEAGRKPRFTRVCTEGPAFDVKKVMWHA
jgi:dihydroorotate dehydrogenase electron transfer subunit